MLKENAGKLDVGNMDANDKRRVGFLGNYL
jgi:hypothetical protein